MAVDPGAEQFQLFLRSRQHTLGQYNLACLQHPRRGGTVAAGGEDRDVGIEGLTLLPEQIMLALQHFGAFDLPQRHAVEGGEIGFVQPVAQGDKPLQRPGE